ncbi:heparinase II/III domain-containing protein [Muricoccus radiodurans]|uniref:heparinase II/III domain-containing protein n=1 Tax=Muricoccus radiodurans TaxID=2231721 RepID=UPI003CEB7700
MGPRPLLWLARHRIGLATGRVARALGEAEAPRGPFLSPRAPAPPPLPAVQRDAVLAAARALGPAVAHGPFDPAAPALSLDLFAPGDVRPVWEANRLAWLPLLAQAHRLQPGGGHLLRAERRLSSWAAANPPWTGPNWACGQEAALRGLHLALAHALLGGGAPGPGLQALLRLHDRRIAVTQAYARAQDNNHTVSEPAGRLAIAWALGGDETRHAAALSRAVARLVAPDGGFAVVSTGYHRLLLDTLSVVEWLRRHHGRPSLPVPLPTRAGAAARWLARLVCPESGGVPRLGHQDGSALADLSLAGPEDARGSAERAARLFLGASAGFPADAGCAWLGLPPGPTLPAEAAWEATGTRGWAAGRTRLLLRTGPLRFRPGQADLLHLDLWHGPENLLRDTGTGAYNPPAESGWWLDHFPSAAAHNLIRFDETEPMPRAGRFLLARWVATERLPDGAATRDAAGRRHARRVRQEGGDWVVEDRVTGRFRTLTLRWHLLPTPWRLCADGVESAAARLRVTTDGPVALALQSAPDSPSYGASREIPCLVLRAGSGISLLRTRITILSSL